jgi:hypothetical protein
MVLSYLGDERAVGAIKQRTQEAIPFFYESMCLLAIGSQQAMDLYSSLIDRYVEAKKAGLEHDDDFKLHSAFVSHAQIANLVTSEVEEFVCRQIDSEETERQLIGRFLAKWLGTERLLLYMVKRWHVEGYLIFGEHGFGQRLAK